ncbi:heme biosynthesis protein HemY [Zhengella mangrovi]|uniref:Heme biosynthesis protein HemY n=1 Tax=Zhengella mangrovi TaxID=1982044 RepID=A0A2G1QSM4_9HYPH|nr:heme biosynthesis protein HemY [Zhengella mangrovi]PHP68495.1 heme biosynthesis protein HemY [Zhengella mangrovi]
MIRLLVFLVIVFALGTGFAWLADRPGMMLITFNGMQYEVSLLVAAVAVVAVVAAIMLAWWVLKAIWTSPHRVSRYFRARKRDRGYQSLSTGLIAAGAGDAETARRMSKQALSMLSADQEPLIHLLDAQTLLLEGDTDGARKKFDAMIEDPETRLLGLRGLYLEAQRQREPEAARHYAEKAAELAPQLGWASSATLEAKTREGEWDAALGLLDKQESTRQIGKDTAARRRAVLLTAKAMAMADADPSAARTAALAALKQAPDLVPAGIVAAKALVRLNDLKKAAKVLETIWKKDPHPEVAQAYVHLRPGDSVTDRLKRAERLQSLKTYHRESAYAVARAAFDAGEFKLAREKLEAVLKQDPRESAYLLLADIEEAETGDQGRVRHWLSMAVRAPRDPAWTADGYVSEFWAPFSPVTGRIDAFEWRVPVERLGAVVDDRPADGGISVMPPAIAAGPSRTDDEIVAGSVAATAAASAAVEHHDADPAVADPEGPSAGAKPDAGMEIIPPAPSERADDAARAEAEDAVMPAAEVNQAAAAPERPAAATPAKSGKAKSDGEPAALSTNTAAAAVSSRAEPAPAPLAEGVNVPDSVDPGRKASSRDRPPVPDDPGVDPNAPEEASVPRFRLF